jgi:acyl carrier protein
MAMTTEEVFDKVKDVLVDALGVDDDEVTPEAKLSADLGAESIDYLDIQFRLEKAFGIKIEKDEMLPENVLSDSRYVQDGKVTDAGMTELRKRLPHADLTGFDKHRGVNEFINVFTVDTMVKFVQSKLAA